ncbi:MAG TPA: ATP-binding protein [Streptosporangiaceae bacterium]
MINSARQGGPPRIRANPEHSPSADVYADWPPTAAPATAGSSCCSCSITLPATVGEVAEARRFVAGFVNDPALVDDAVLCVSELATNAVIHSNSRLAGGRFAVAAERYSDGHFRIMVLDRGGRWIERAKDGREHLGLMMVSRLASAWGVDGDGLHGRVVWFELLPVPAPGT